MYYKINYLALIKTNPSKYATTDENQECLDFLLLDFMPHQQLVYKSINIIAMSAVPILKFEHCNKKYKPLKLG